MDMNETYRGIDPIDMDRVAAQASEEVSRRLENTPERYLTAPRYVIDSLAAWYIDGYLDDEEMADDALDRALERLPESAGSRERAIAYAQVLAAVACSHAQADLCNIQEKGDFMERALFCLEEDVADESIGRTDENMRATGNRVQNDSIPMRRAR